MGHAIAIHSPKITISQIQQESFIYAVDTGTANAYAIALTPAPTIVAGSIAVVKIANGNTGASTLAVNGGAATAIKQEGTEALEAGDLNAGQIAIFIFDGTNWQWIGSTGAAGPSPYHLVCFFPGTPGASQLVMWTCTSDLPSGVTFPGNFTGSSGRCLALPTSSAVFTINKIPSGSTTPTAFGTVTISTLGVFTFATTSGAAASFAVGDSLTAVAPSSPDATLANVEFTLAGARLEGLFVAELQGALGEARSRLSSDVVKHLEAFAAGIAPKFLGVQLPLYQVMSAVRASAERKGIGMTDEIASGWNCLEISYDAVLDVLTVEGVKYSGGLFRHFAPGALGFETVPNSVFKVKSHENGTAIIQIVTDRELSHRFDLLAKAGI